MDEIYNLKKFTLREIKALLHGLNSIQISGVDALFIANLQIKLNDQIVKIEEDLKNPSIGEEK